MSNNAGNLNKVAKQKDLMDGVGKTSREVSVWALDLGLDCLYDS